MLQVLRYRQAGQAAQQVLWLTRVEISLQGKDASF